MTDRVVILDETYGAGAPMFFDTERKTILRRIDPENAFLADEGLRNRLVSAGVVDYDIVRVGGVEYFETVPFFFPNSGANWSLGMMRDCLDLVDRLATTLDDLGLGLIDGHCFNTVFFFAQPKFVDLGSIREGRTSAGKREARLYRKALLSYRIGSARRTRKRLDIELEHPRFSDVAKDILGADPFVPWRSKALRLMGFRGASLWQNYYSGDPGAYADAPKEAVVNAILAELRPATVYDIGCNTGHYSLLAESGGAAVVACDPDPDCIEYLYTRSKEGERRILPLVADLDGFMRAITRTYPRLRARRVDTVLLLALTHHLAYRGGYDFGDLFERLATIGAESAVIELVTKKDANVAEWDRAKPLPWYTLEGLCDAARRHFPRTRVFDEHDSERPIVLFQRGPA